MKVDPSEFEEWACWFSGCDGGNPNADTWICGIEWGGDNTKEYYESELPSEIQDQERDLPKRYDWKEQQKWTFGKSVAKLYTAYRGEDIYNYTNHLEEFGDQCLFKLNLYPIAFRHTGYDLWRKHKLDEITGFKDKELYRIWCFFNRFPKFAERAEKHAPKLIIGLGTSYLTDFFACFAGNDRVPHDLRVETATPKSATNRSARTWYWAELENKGKENPTVLAVIPFFSGSNGLNSYHLLEQVGKRLREIVRPD